MEPREQVSVNCYCKPEPCCYIKDYHKCFAECTDKKCIVVCPAKVITERDGRIWVDAQGKCLECGACRLVCENILFDYPAAGQGIVHRFG